jgi:tetratricopeptide (TPR) repeat protein
VFGQIAMNMSDSTITILLEDLKNPNEVIRERATQELWRIWFEQKGILGLEVIRRAQILLDMGDFSKAEEALTRLIKQQPDFAEAWNRRAVLYYMQGQYHRAIADCQMAIRLNPFHFGALHGLGLCHAALEDYPQAIQTFHRVLKIQPYSLENQRLLLECTVRLN